MKRAMRAEILAGVHAEGVDNSSDVQSLPTQHSWPKFPAGWAVENAAAERVFARLVWFLVPLQYYVLTHMAGGQSPDDLISVAVLALFSVAIVLLAGLGAAWMIWWFRDQKTSVEDFTELVRVWVVALLIGTFAAYTLLAISLYVGVRTGYDGDILGSVFYNLSNGAGGSVPGLNWPTYTSYLFYAYTGVLAVTIVLQARRGSDARRAAHSTTHDPGVVWVGAIVAAIMFCVNNIATL